MFQTFSGLALCRMLERVSVDTVPLHYWDFIQKLGNLIKFLVTKMCEVWFLGVSGPPCWYCGTLGLG